MKRNKNWILFLIILILVPIVSLLILSLYSRLFYFNSINPEVNKSNNTITKVIQLDILNGCGEDGIAKKARIYLKNRGFDVVQVGNFDKIVDVSYVIDRKGDIESAKMLAKAIGIKDSLLQIVIDSSMSLDCSIVIGKDFKKLKPYISGE
jgi:hypothetical protein